MNHKSLSIRCAALLLLLLGVSGCRGAPQAAPVDPALARQTLVRVLESWREGRSVRHWKQQTPPVVIQDADWQAGRSLSDFELLESGRAQDANLRCPVRLVLRDEQGRERQQQVVYLVGTDPVLTVFRDPFASL